MKRGRKKIDLSMWREQIIEWRSSAASLNAIVSKLAECGVEVEYQTLRKRMREMGLGTSLAARGQILTTRARNIIQARRSGLTYVEISTEFGITKQGVGQILKSHEKRTGEHGLTKWRSYRTPETVRRMTAADLGE